MYDLPDSVLASLRRYRISILICLLLLLAGLFSHFRLIYSGTDLRATFTEQTRSADQAPSTVYAISLIADQTWQHIAALPYRTAKLALIGLCANSLLVLMGCKSLWTVVFSLLYPLGAMACVATDLLIALEIPASGGFDAAHQVWQQANLIAYGLNYLALTVMLLAVSWRMLRVPPPGRDDMSTFVEL